MYHSHAETIWPDGTFNNGKCLLPEQETQGRLVCVCSHLLRRRQPWGPCRISYPWRRSSSRAKDTGQVSLRLFPTYWGEGSLEVLAEFLIYDEGLLPEQRTQETLFLPTEAKAALRSLAVMMPSLSASMMPNASLNSWICFWLKRVKMFDPDFLAFFPFGA